MSSDVVLYCIGDEVYHRTSSDVGIVIGILMREYGTVYGVVWSNAGNECWHYSVELVKEKPVVGVNTKDE